MTAINLCDGIDLVGVLDAGLRDFHGFETPFGTTYNVYLVSGTEKTALIDTVNASFVPEMLERVAEIVALDSIDYIVVNHVEPDHNGGLKLVCDALPNAEVLCSAGAARAIPDFHGPDIALTVVGADDVIDLGGKTLRFMPMPMVHWPDSMFTYVAECKALLPNDAFGQHYGVPGTRFVSQDNLSEVLAAVDLYYANILMPLAGPIAKAIEKLGESGWAVETIAPSHGLIWTGPYIDDVMEAYGRNLSGQGDGSVTLAYSTAWHSTEMIAGILATKLADRGITVHMFDLAASEYSEVTLAVMKSDALIVGSPTLHNSMFYKTASYLQYLSGLHPKVKLAAVFGSFGWSSGATKQMRAALEAMGCTLPLSDLQIRYRPLSGDEPTIDAWVEEFVAAFTG